MFYGALNADEGRYFQTTPNKRLMTSWQPAVAVVRKDVTSHFECGLWCLKLGKTFCRSFNLEKQTTASHGRECELLLVGGNERSDFLKESNGFDHFHLMDACSPNPCKNGGKCIPSDEGSYYTCTCVSHTGRNCGLKQYMRE
ncbi:hypothetical protein AC249_AIPGENE29002 [Exaiptasia diaphana]|nr:hypothetical protein AC249_AIPGENE29002 [Exaiptasia diaphana]